MTAEIIPFTQPPRMIVICGNCGCATWECFNDFTVECAHCGNTCDGSEWVTPIKDAPEHPEKDDGEAIRVSALGSPVFARRSVIKKITDDADELGLVAGFFRDGAGSHWADINSAAQRDWAVRKLRDLADMIEKVAVDG